MIVHIVFWRLHERANGKTRQENALDAYQLHPAHKEIVGFLKDVRSERRVVDYELSR